MYCKCFETSASRLRLLRRIAGGTPGFGRAGATRPKHLHNFRIEDGNRTGSRRERATCDVRPQCTLAGHSARLTAQNRGHWRQPAQQKTDVAKHYNESRRVGLLKNAPPELSRAAPYQVIRKSGIHMLLTQPPTCLRIVPGQSGEYNGLRAKVCCDVCQSSVRLCNPAPEIVSQRLDVPSLVASRGV